MILETTKNNNNRSPAGVISPDKHRISEDHYVNVKSASLLHHNMKQKRFDLLANIINSDCRGRYKNITNDM